jgi:small-conductance mechanosensitive channel
MTKRGQKLEIICKATRTAADNPKMDCDNTVVQIQEIGASLKSTTDALNKQNKAVADLGKQNAAEQQAAAESEKAAQKRAVHADSTSARLKASAASPAVLAKPCEPSKELVGAWK